MVRAELPDHEIETHFTPRYNPWDQRLCLVPDGDLFRAIREGKADVETDTIERFVSEGVLLKSGKTLPADIVVTATGLELQLLSDVQFSVDGEAKDLSRTINYKGMMYSGIPNMASSFGYTNASWTLKVDLSCDYVCRLVRRMERKGKPIAVARPDPAMQPAPFLDFSSGYVRRALDILPNQGAARPWRLYQNYLLDLFTLRFGRIEDGVLTLARPPATKGAAAESILEDA